MKGFDRLLVVVPHPDDEALLAAGTIRRFLLEGGQVSVAIVTNGDYLCPDYTKGQMRLRESLTVLRQLGVCQENIYLLGYPDTGYEPEVSFLGRLWEASPHALLASTASSCTYALPEHPDYCMQRTGNHAAYTRAAFVADLETLLDTVRPHLVITTAEADLHGDHSALFRFVQQATRRMFSPQPTLWVGMVHSPDGDLSWPTLTPEISSFEQPTTDWGPQLAWARRITLHLPDQMLAKHTDHSEKHRLISLYHTALNPQEPQVCDYLLAFAKGEEIFWEIPN